jgi:hypothetical protein
MSIGPVIDLDQDRLPIWLSDWSGDMPSLAAFSCDFIETFINRYRSYGFTHWELFSGFNQADWLGLNEDDCLRLAARLLDSARQTDAEGNWSIGIAEPWGEYLLSDEHTYSPYIFSDTLLRAGYRISSINLDLRPMQRNGTRVLRDPLELNRLLELFGESGISLEVTLGNGNRHMPLGGREPADVNWSATNVILAAALPQVQVVAWGAEDCPAPAALDTGEDTVSELNDILTTFQKLRSFVH